MQKNSGVSPETTRKILIGFAILIGLFILFSSISGNNTDINSQSDSFQPTRTLTKDEKCRKDLDSGIPFEYSSCSEVDLFAREQTEAYFDSLPNPLEEQNTTNYSPSSSGCPSGCTYHKSGCDIKGNVSLDTYEKIYHLPNMNFYSDAYINVDKGERWFCTESEAIANGWRKAQN